MCGIGTRFLFASVWAAIFACRASADAIIFSNLGAGNTYQTNIGWAVQGANINPGEYDRAMQFVGKGGTLSSIGIAFGGILQNSPPVQLQLMLAQDNFGMPGAAIETWNVSNYDLLRVAPGGLLIVYAGAFVNLQPNQPYWLIADAIDPNLNADWFWNSTNNIGLVGQRANAGNWTVSAQIEGAFIVSAFPEPGSFWLMVCAASVLVVAKRVR